MTSSQGITVLDTEYKVRGFYGDLADAEERMEESLNILSKDGWIVHSVTPYTESEGLSGFLVIMQRLVERV